MGHVLDARPLPVRLQKRIEKYQQAGRSGPLATDVHLHRQSMEAMSELIKALELVTDCLSNALTGGEVSAARAGQAMVTAAELIAKQKN